MVPPLRLDFNKVPGYSSFNQNRRIWHLTESALKAASESSQTPKDSNSPDLSVTEAGASTSLGASTSFEPPKDNNVSTSTSFEVLAVAKATSESLKEAKSPKERVDTYPTHPIYGDLSYEEGIFFLYEKFLEEEYGLKPKNGVFFRNQFDSYKLYIQYLSKETREAIEANKKPEKGSTRGSRRSKKVVATMYVNKAFEKLSVPSTTGEGATIAPVYTMQSIICTGGLLGVFLTHPWYFVSNPLEKLKNLTRMCFLLEDELNTFFSKKYRHDIKDQADLLCNAFARSQEIANITDPSATWKAKKELEEDRDYHFNYLLTVLAWEYFAASITKGIAVTTKKVPFKHESVVVPMLCISDIEMRPILIPLGERFVKNYGVTLRSFAKLLHSFIFYFCYKNSVEGYLCNKLSHAIQPCRKAEDFAYQKALFVEGYETNPFVTPLIKSALESHAKENGRNGSNGSPKRPKL